MNQSTKLAKISESRSELIREDVKFDSGHGLLPSDCCKCKGALDFARVRNYFGEMTTVLKCRDCGLEFDLDDFS